MSENKIKFEEELKHLDEIVSTLQDSKMSLDKSLNLYEEGMKIIKNLEKVLKESSEKVENIVSIE